MTDNINQRGGRVVLLLIAGLPVTMILAATWLWYFVERGDIDIVGALGTANSGDLLSDPLNIQTLSFSSADGSTVSLAPLEPKWTFLVLNDGDVCDEACNELLYLTRQIRIAIGRDYQRTQRLLLVDTPVKDIQLVTDNTRPLAAEIEIEHTDLTVWQRGDEAVVPEQSLQPNAWYLVDPSGWVMMRYSTDVNYKDVIGDLKFLLKNSGG